MTGALPLFELEAEAIPQRPEEIKLERFQRDFIAQATSPHIDIAALSMPRGNGKSWLSGHLVKRIMSPEDELFRPGTESVLCAASIEQARIVFRFARHALEWRGQYRFLDSATRCAITHIPTNTRLRVIGSNGKTAMGLVDTPWAICDEPGAWETTGGELMWDALVTAQGKPGSPLKIWLVGTLAPARSGWWLDLVEAGTTGTTYVMLKQGDRKTWDQWQTIRKANPLTRVSPEFRRKLLQERDEARKDSRKKSRYLSYRENIPDVDESEVPLTVEQWELVEAREVAERAGKPIVCFDLGQNRAWSAALAIWQTGRVEALALCPGIPSVEDQEKRDRVPAGTYSKLIETGTLRLAVDDKGTRLRVPPPGLLVDAAFEAWGTPARIVADRLKLGELEDAVAGRCYIEPRIPRWSSSTEDITALRRIASDGPLSVAEESRPLLTASLAVAKVKGDDAGMVRPVKAANSNTARDDVFITLMLAAGAFVRAGRRTA